MNIHERLLNWSYYVTEHHRRALKAFYVSHPYQSNHSIANYLRINVKKLENDLQEARTRINKELNRKLSGDKAVR